MRIVERYRIIEENETIRTTFNMGNYSFEVDETGNIISSYDPRDKEYPLDLNFVPFIPFDKICKLCGSKLCLTENIIKTRFLVYCSNPGCKLNYNFMKKSNKYLKRGILPKDAVNIFNELESEVLDGRM